VNRGRDEDLDEDALKELILKLYYYGLKTVEWTGGGDPTIWHSIEELIAWTDFHKIQQGLITNGIELTKRISKKRLDLLKWIRISMNGLDYGVDMIIPEMQGTLGFSYVMNEKTTNVVLLKLDSYVHTHKPTYVRIVPNCQATDEQQESNNRILAEKVAEMGSPYFYQAKVFHKPEACYWCYLKPFVLHDSWVYPCSSVVLNYDAERKFHEKYRWVKMEDLPSVYANKIRPLPTEHCNHCVFFEQNELIKNIIQPSGMEDFI
jgi:MoaA/NifB/PqqE/SkfB family radical SAM enzyme